MLHLWVLYVVDDTWCWLSACNGLGMDWYKASFKKDTIQEVNLNDISISIAPINKEAKMHKHTCFREILLIIAEIF